MTLKINWFSNAPWGVSGYSNQTKTFVPRLKKLGHEMSITAFYGLEGGMLNMDGVPVYPRAFHPYGADVLSANATHAGADLVISLVDIWVFNVDMIAGHTRWAPWFPIDSAPLAPPVAENARRAFKRIVFSKFGCKVMEQAGLDYYYVPHGVDCEIYQPMDMAEARKKLGLPQDKFIVGMVAANKGTPSRKAFQQQLEAFAMLKARHKDATMYLHTCMAQHGENAGVDLPAFCDFLGLKWAMLSPQNDGREDVIFCDQYANTMGIFYPDYMRAAYAAMDAHTLVSQGEGFGIPIVEAQACGTPVITGEWTAMGELCFSGWKVPIEDAQPVWNPLKTYQYSPEPDAIYRCMEAAYKQKGKQSLRTKARQGALEYDADLVTDKYWKPVLEDIEQALNEGAVDFDTAMRSNGRQWTGVGLYNPDGSIDIPDKLSGDALRKYPGGRSEIIPGGFTNPLSLKFSEPDGLEWLLMREVERDYKIDDLGLGADSVVIDIGAHVGVVSMTLAKKFGCKVYAFEPSDHNFRRLQANVTANGLDDLVKPSQYAVTKDGRDVKLSRAEGNSGGATICTSVGDDVASLSLKNILCVAERIDLLKIDCEGAEYEILEGADLSKVKAIRGEFHGARAAALLEEVRKQVPDTVVTLQGERNE